MDENKWADAFALELLRLGTHGKANYMIELGHQYYNTEGTLDPVEVARREFVDQPARDD